MISLRLVCGAAETLKTRDIFTEAIIAAQDTRGGGIFLLKAQSLLFPKYSYGVG